MKSGNTVLIPAPFSYTNANSWHFSFPFMWYQWKGISALKSVEKIFLLKKYINRYHYQLNLVFQYNSHWSPEGTNVKGYSCFFLLSEHTAHFQSVISCHQDRATSAEPFPLFQLSIISPVQLISYVTKR